MKKIYLGLVFVQISSVAAFAAGGPFDYRMNQRIQALTEQCGIQDSQKAMNECLVPIQSALRAMFVPMEDFIISSNPTFLKNRDAELAKLAKEKGTVCDHIQANVNAKPFYVSLCKLSYDANFMSDHLPATSSKKAFTYNCRDDGKGTRPGRPVLFLDHMMRLQGDGDGFVGKYAKTNDAAHSHYNFIAGQTADVASALVKNGNPTGVTEGHIRLNLGPGDAIPTPSNLTVSTQTCQRDDLKSLLGGTLPLDPAVIAKVLKGNHSSAGGAAETAPADNSSAQ